MGNKKLRKRKGFQKYYRRKGKHLSKSRLVAASDQNETNNTKSNIANEKQVEEIRHVISPSLPVDVQMLEQSELIKQVEETLQETLPSLPVDVQCKEDGRRIINFKSFYSKLQEISAHEPFNCGLQSVEIISEKQAGYKSIFSLKCKLCSKLFYLSSDEGSEMDINNCAVLGTVAIGCGLTQLQELSASLDLPAMSSNTYKKCHNNLANMWENISLKCMHDAAKEEREIALSQSRWDENGVPIIDVIVDGCWSKRTYKNNYSALSGAAVIIGKNTGKILYIGIKNKYCCICAQAKEIPPHKCFKNYSGPSTGMESEIIVEGFKCSINMHGLIYGRMISDGDSSTYSKIIETRPYSNITVQKIECKNHIMRNLCNKLTALKSDTRYALRFRKKITDQKIKTIRFTIKKAILKYYSDSESEKRVNIEPLYDDILRAHRHAFGDHSTCKQYFCKTPNINSSDIEFQTSTLWSKICQLLSNVASHAPSLVHNVESNRAENYNSIVAKLVGGKRVNYSLRGAYENRCKGAAISYNTNKLLSCTYKYATGNSPKGKMKQLEKKRLKKNTISSKKYIRKKKTSFLSKGEDINYGENCAKEDIDPAIMKIEKTTFINNLKKNKEERERIEKDTILQSLCSEWLELRRKLLTASNFGRVIKRRPNTSCNKLVIDLLYKDSINHIKSIKHGCENEKIALSQLSEDTGYIIKPCGLFIDQDLPYLGASPDGTCDDMIVEIKCPLSAYQLPFLEAVTKKKIPFYQINNDGIANVNTNHNWYYQIQGQLHITKKTKCLFGLWLGDSVPMKIEIIKKDDRFWKEKMENKLTTFYLDCLLPELIDPRHTRKMSVRDPFYIQNAIEEKARKDVKKRKRNDITENIIKVKETTDERRDQIKVDKNADLSKEKDKITRAEKENKENNVARPAVLPNVLIVQYGDVSDDEESFLPVKRCKVLQQRNLNFNEF